MDLTLVANSKSEAILFWMRGQQHLLTTGLPSLTG